MHAVIDEQTITKAANLLLAAAPGSKVILWRDTPNTVINEAAEKSKVYEQVA